MMDEIWRYLYQEQKEYLSVDGFDPDENLKMKIEKQTNAFLARVATRQVVLA